MISCDDNTLLSYETAQLLMYRLAFKPGNPPPSAAAPTAASSKQPCNGGLQPSLVHSHVKDKIFSVRILISASVCQGDCYKQRGVKT